MDFNDLRKKIEKAAKQAFSEIFEKHKEEGIYSFALYSDEGAMTVCPAANSLKHLEEADQDELAYYKFEPAEWKYEMMGAADVFNEISSLCRREVLEKEDDEEWFDMFQSTLFETCISVLEKLKKENFFTKISGNDIFLTFVVSHYEFSTNEMLDIIRRLNDNEYKNEYLEWTKTWYEEE